MNDMHNMQCIAYIYIRYFSNFAPVFCQGFKLRCTEYQVIEGGMKCWKISLECNYLFPDFWAACLLGERQERCNLLTRFLRNLIHAFLLFNIPKSAETKKEEGDKMISKRKRKRPSARTSRAEKCSNGTTPLRRASQILSHASPLNFWLVIPIWEIVSFYQTRSVTILKTTPCFIISILCDAFKFCLHKQERLLSEVKLRGLHKFDKTLKLKSYYAKVDRRFERNSHRPIQYDHSVCSLTRFVCTLYIYVELLVSGLRF